MLMHPHPTPASPRSGRVERGSLFKANREAKSVTWYESHKKYYVPDAGKIRIISSAP